MLGVEKKKLVDHLRWLKQGKRGSGQLVLEGADLRDKRLDAVDISGAQFVRCKFDGANMSFLTFDDGEMVECTGLKGKLLRSRYRRTYLKECCFIDCDLRMNYFEDAHISGGDWSRCLLERAGFEKARVEKVRFSDGNLKDTTWDGANVLDCSFEAADLSDAKSKERFILARAYGARFVRCDFRGAKLEGWRLKDTVFDHCRFEGATGRPSLEGTVELIACDRTTEQMLAQWR
jgi:uncharacterized protein YjbI with pentapeptide repeats